MPPRGPPIGPTPRCTVPGRPHPSTRRRQRSAPVDRRADRSDRRRPYRHRPVGVTRPTVVGDRLERSDQPDVVRDVRLPKAVRLSPQVRALLGSLAEQMIPMIDSDDPVATRLFPPAYIGTHASEAEQQYRELVDGALHSHHHHAAQVLTKTVTADSLSADELAGWLAAIGSMRLVIGTRLDVSEGMVDPVPGDPSEPEHAAFHLLGVLQATIIDVLGTELPDDGEPASAL